MGAFWLLLSYIGLTLGLAVSVTCFKLAWILAFKQYTLHEKQSLVFNKKNNRFETRRYFVPHLDIWREADASKGEKR